MKSLESSCSLLLAALLLATYHWSPVDSLCSLTELTTARCHELDDARWIDTYHLLILKAPSLSKSLEPGYFKNLTSLKHLDLSDGKLELIKSNSFARLDLLQTLNLADNRINHLEAGAFDGLDELHSLKLRNNALDKLPVALLTLPKLKLLDLSQNPLNCDCASMKLRDALMDRGVKITKHTMCVEPPAAKHQPFIKPSTDSVCAFEEQDREMQADQPAASEENAEGSGEVEEAANEASSEEKEAEAPVTEKTEEETVPDATVTSEATTTTSSTTEASTAALETSSSTAASKDDLTFDSTDSSDESVTTLVPDTEEDESADSAKDDDLIAAEPVPTEASSTESSPDATSEKTDDSVVPDAGSGEEDEGSGVEGSGAIVNAMPTISYNDAATEGEEDQENNSTSSSSTTTTESSGGWFSGGGLLDPFSYLPSFGTSPSTEEPKTTESMSDKTEDALKEEEFIQVSTTEASTTKQPVEEPIVPPRVISADEKSPLPSSNNHPFDTAYSQEANKGMGSYIILAILLAILVMLVIIAAYKGDLCRKKSKRRDVERGTEMKDMQKSLLEQGGNPPKIQVTNGNTLENVPLMTPSSPPEEPKQNQRSYDITPANGSSNRTNGHALDNDAVIKPPRKSANHEIEAPLNGLNPPMDAIDGPTTESVLGSNEVLNGDCCEKPPLSPGAQRVKITLNENPDSVKKTPVLITRINDLVTTP